ncbi:hypothetical protein [Nostoc sp.]|uniref:hypothetical protein n=1 Tax=Nostoc sp. TaxID=1180 RepID=UPI002FFC9271
MKRQGILAHAARGGMSKKTFVLGTVMPNKRSRSMHLKIKCSQTKPGFQSQNFGLLGMD